MGMSLALSSIRLDPLYNNIANIFGGASLYLPLTHSLVPQRGTGTATYTGATAKTVRDHEGVLRTVPAGCARFEGARYVRNLFTTSSENFSAGWTTTNSTVVTGSGGGLPVSGGYAEFASAVGSPQLRQVASPLVVNNRYVLSFFVLMSDNSEPNTTTGGTYRDFTLVVNGGDISNYAAITNTAIGNGVWRVSYPFIATITTLPILRKYDGLSTATALRVSGLMMEDITGRTDQTTPSEYVSVGALDYRSEQDPLYLSLPGTAGNYLSTPNAAANQITGDLQIIAKIASAAYATINQTIVAKDGASSAYALQLSRSAGSKALSLIVWQSAAAKVATSSASLTTADGAEVWVKVTLVVATGKVNFYTSQDGVAYTILGVEQSITAAATDAGTSAVAIGANTGGTANLFVGKIYSAQIYNTIGGTTPVVDFNPHRDATTPTGTITSSTTGEVWTINGASSVVRNATYHGAGVDGVKYFNTDLDGNPLPTEYTYDAVSLNGVAGTYVSTPNATANRVTGTIDIDVGMAASDWTPAAGMKLLAKLNASAGAGQWCYDFTLNATTGLLSARFSHDGSTLTSFNSSVAPTIADGAMLYVRVVMVPTNGANSTATYYTSSDRITWTQLGTQQTSTARASIFAGSDAVGIGGYPTDGSTPLAGKVYVASIYNGDREAGGTLAVDFDASRYAGGTTLTGSTGETWTLQGNAVIHPTNNPMLGYSAEGARTNLCLQSNAFTTTWTAYNAGIATQNVVGPDGSTSAWTLTDNSAVVAMGVRQSIALTAAAHTVSAFVKKTVGLQSSYPVIYLDDNVSKGASCTIDTTNGVATVWTAYTGLTIVTSSASCVSYNDDYWRVSLVLLATAATWTLYLLPAATTNATQSTGVWDVAAQGSAVFYGAQVELGSFASSYIATTTAAVTRNADVLTYSSAGNIDGTKGWCYAEVAVTGENGRIISAGGGVGVPLGLSSSVVLGIYDGTAWRTDGSITRGSPPAKMASSWSATAAVSLSGAVTTGLTYVGMTPSVIGIGSDAVGTAQLYGTIRNVRIGQRQLSASEMQAITNVV